MAHPANDHTSDDRHSGASYTSGAPAAVNKKVVPIYVGRRGEAGSDGNANTPGDPPDGRPVIRVANGELSRMVTEAESALLASDVEIFQRGGELVRLARIDTTQAAITEAALQGGTLGSKVHRSEGAVIIRSVTSDYLQLALSRVASFVRGTGSRTKPVDVPSKVAALLLAGADESHFPWLAGIVHAPTLRTNGTLLASRGYDQASGLYACFAADTFPDINPKPSRAEALSALATLREVFSESVFSGGSDSPGAAVAVAACITAVVRPALSIAPLFGFSAAKRGSGKTVAAQVAARLVTGRDAPVIAPTDDESELKKALLAILIGGDPAVLLDNFARPVESAALCALLTSESYKDRVLGRSEVIEAPTRVTILATGNALEFVGDLTSRALLATLDPAEEHPERRPFKRDLAAYVAARRGELVKACLTIPLAYLAIERERPAQTAERSRFADWDRFVRYPLLWLGSADPLKTQDELRAVDPDREQLAALLHAWRDAFGAQPATVAEVTGAASSKPELLEALQTVAGDQRGNVNTRRLGRYLVRHLRRREDGLRFEDGGKDSATWKRRFLVSLVSNVISNPSREQMGNIESVAAERNEGNGGNGESSCTRCRDEGCSWCQP